MSTTELEARRSVVPHRVGGGVSEGLDLRHVSKRFGSVQALDDCSFSVAPGRMVGFLGPNGAGKTTTMRAIFGLVDLDAGDLSWCGRPIGPSERLRFGYMPEERGLYPRMPVAEQLSYFARLHGMTANGDAQRQRAGWSASDSPSVRAIGWRSSRMATSSESSSPRPYCMSPSYSCSTSPSQVSIPWRCERWLKFCVRRLRVAAQSSSPATNSSWWRRSAKRSR